MEAPDGAALLEIARRTLLDDIVPVLEGDARFKALMIANAIAIALRERSEPPVTHDLSDGAALRGAIRSGVYDPGTPDHLRIAAALLALAEARCRISAPKALAPPVTG
jgi:hypothetical protein